MVVFRNQHPLQSIILVLKHFTNCVSDGLGHAHGTSLKTWQLIFLVIGLINFVWSWVFLWVMPDSPSSAKFLTHKQRIVAIDRIASNMIGVKTKQFQPRQALEAVLDIKVHCLSLIALGCGVVRKLGVQVPDTRRKQDPSLSDIAYALYI